MLALPCARTLAVNARDMLARLMHVLMRGIMQCTSWIGLGNNNNNQQHPAPPPPPYHPHAPAIHAQPRRPCRFGLSHKFALLMLVVVLAVVVAKRSEWREFKHQFSNYYSRPNSQGFGNHGKFLYSLYLFHISSF